LNGEGVPAHEKRERSQEHIKDVERALKLLVECLKENRYNLSTLEVEEINNEMVGKVFTFLEEKKYSARTFNKVIGFYTSFISWYSKEYDILMRNYFERIHRKNLNPKPESITYKEFEALLEKVIPENGLKEYENGVKPERNLYRPWLVHGFLLALETGRRREEVINMKWNDIKESEGTQFIKIEDFKVNRIQNRIKPEEKKFVYVPITESLSELLKEMGEDKYKGTNKFILAPESTISRKKVMADILSKGFSHFYKQLNTGRNLTFKCLRKTYITRLEIFMGHANTKAITGHSDDSVIEKSYLDKRELAKAAKNFQVFRNEEERGNNLKEIRETSKTNSKQLNK
jgi:integrase